MSHYARSVGISRGMKQKTPESIVLESVLAYLEFHHKVAWVERINTGAARLKGFHVKFGFVGCSDIIGQLRDGRFLAVECKAARSKPTEEQQAFLARVKANGGVSGIARSIEDAEALLT